MLDVFNSDAFHFRRLTEAINAIPHTPQQIASLGDFESRPVDSDLIAIEEKAGVIEILQERERQAVAQQLTEEKATLRPFRIPAFKQERRLYSDQIFKSREFGSEQAMKTMIRERDLRLASMRLNHDVTIEWRRLGAYKGTILAPDGTTVILNLFTEFNVSQEAEVDLNLDASTDTGAVQAAFAAIKRTILKNLGGTPVRGIHAFWSASAWDAFIKNVEVRESWRRFQDSSFLRTDHVFSSFSWGGIDNEEYRGTVGGVDFIAADKVIFFPVGVPGLYLDHWAPGTWFEAKEMPGLPFYSKAAPDLRLNEYVDLHSQFHHLPICTRPKVLMKGKIT